QRRGLGPQPAQRVGAAHPSRPQTPPAQGGHRRAGPHRSRAHALVEANTFPFLNGLAHFVPNTKLAEVSAKLKELEKEFWQAKAAFLERYGALRESAAKEWRTMATKLVSDPDRLVATIEASF